MKTQSGWAAQNLCLVPTQNGLQHHDFCFNDYAELWAGSKNNFCVPGVSAPGNNKYNACGISIIHDDETLG